MNGQLDWLSALVWVLFGILVAGWLATVFWKAWQSNKKDRKLVAFPDVTEETQIPVVGVNWTLTSDGAAEFNRHWTAFVEKQKPLPSESLPVTDKAGRKNDLFMWLIADALGRN
jgi:hypothetical protein